MSTTLERLVAEAAVLAGGKHPCATLGHHWVFYGGGGCGCPDCCGNGCSIPVHKCAACGDFDYGDNAEADEIMAQCLAEDVL